MTTYAADTGSGGTTTSQEPYINPAYSHLKPELGAYYTRLYGSPDGTSSSTGSGDITVADNPYPTPQIIDYSQGPAFQQRPMVQPPNMQYGMGGQNQIPFQGLQIPQAQQPQGQQPGFTNPSDIMQSAMMNYGRHFGGNPFANLR